MFLAGASNLEANKEWINELNVFPVPDGDTGTNMTLTIMSAAKEVASLEELNLETLAKAISSGSLRGARGNSGVILSQLLRGFTKVIKYEKEITTELIVEAFQKAVATAYKAVMKPKEGTILTVAKGFAEKASELASEGAEMEEVLGGALAHAEEVLAQTPELLPVLKEAGVVDSGGQGLIQVLKGAFDAYLGKEVNYVIEGQEKTSGAGAEVSVEAQAEIKFGYCTEFIIRTRKPMDEAEELAFKAFLESIGDSIVVVADEDIVKVHVHTNEPGVAITKALTYGELSRMKIDNMREEHQEKLIKDASKHAQEEAKAEKPEKPAMPHKENGFISVSIGEGIGEIFKGLGVDYLIEGGQTMNPSTEDMLNAIDQVNADTIYILPNNKNIILAANQAQALTKDKQIVVIPTRTVPQGISAIINFAPDKSAEENKEAMTEGLSMIKTGQITYAVRDTHIDDKTIHEGDIMGIGDHSILAVGNDIAAVTEETVSLMMDEDSELISVYYGSDVTEEDAQAVGKELKEKYPDCEVEVYSGGQPIYYYVVSVE
ncbi:DAK2 domain fusion protein YloV [Marvinbryantia formatexigens DSM 14469]|uniref:DAK2 domain fusion protein YloV n=2 Tax=Marvinbryantia TaxID=248744 RepID=C6LER9_9FIRM|nr:DAK2 domain fusion protein YloV [Marvinbryantia formatexigens DSM 14469]